MLLKGFVHGGRVVVPQEGRLKWAVCRISDGLILRKFYFKKDAMRYIDQQNGGKS